MEQTTRVGRHINITSQTRLYGVLGHPVGHSLSPQMQNAAMAEMGLDAAYLAFDVPAERLEEALRGLVVLGAGGVNLTIPLKERAVSLVDWLSPEAGRIGAVNTIRFVEGRLEGYNTDAPGFLRSLRDWGLDPAGKRCVVLGAGGSARAVAEALLGAGALVTLANRTVKRADELAQVLLDGGRDRIVGVVPMEGAPLARALADAELLVNTTSVGMTPHADDPPPAAPEALHPHLLVYDLIYNPAETRLLAAARERRARTCNGLSMLAHQGALALEIWTRQTAPVATMERALREALHA